MHEDGCDNCGEVRELYHNEASGLAYCDACETASENEGESTPEVGQYHGELLALIEGSRNPVLAMHLPPAMVEQAEQLLALPEESVAALVEAARLMVGAAEFGR